MDNLTAWIYFHFKKHFSWIYSFNVVIVSGGHSWAVFLVFSQSATRLWNIHAWVDQCWCFDPIPILSQNSPKVWYSSCTQEDTRNINDSDQDVQRDVRLHTPIKLSLISFVHGSTVWHALPDPGIEPRPSAWRCRILATPDAGRL